MHKIHFIYGSGHGFSGQRFASEMLMMGLRQRGWSVEVIQTPVLDRVSASSWSSEVGERLMLTLRLLSAWLKGLRLALGSEILHVNLGQTCFALLRDGFPLLVRSVLAPYRQTQAIVSLHGNVFMSWNDQSVETRLLRQIAKTVRYVTVLGPRQKDRLARFGIRPEKVIQIDNSCLIAPITEQECQNKHVISAAQPLRILYLSSLIETKGYPEFVEAIGQLAAQATFPVEAILCGKITVMGSDCRFPTRIIARSWLESQIHLINQSPQVRLRWINGAEGKAKESLFQEAQIFILPSQYRVEAQPIAVLEALASGCAVITTKVGEIPTTVSHQTALLLDEATPTSIVAAIIELQQSPQKRLQLAQKGLHLFKQRFAYEKHIDLWEKILLEISGDRDHGQA